MVRFVFLLTDFIYMKKKDEFANLMVEKTKKLKIGNGMEKDTIRTAMYKEKT